MARIFSTCPFYTQYVCEFTPWSPHHIQNNPKLWPFFKGVVGTIDGSHININCPASMHDACCNRKASYCKIAFLPVLLTCSSPMHCVAGKGPPQMLVFGKIQKVSAFQRDVFYWWTQDFHIVKSYLCLSRWSISFI